MGFRPQEDPKSRSPNSGPEHFYSMVKFADVCLVVGRLLVGDSTGKITVYGFELARRGVQGHAWSLFFQVGIVLNRGLKGHIHARQGRYPK